MRLHLRIYIDARSCWRRLYLFRIDLAQAAGRIEAGAVDRIEPLHIISPQVFQRLLQPVFTCAAQVHAADEGVYCAARKHAVHMQQRIDHAGVGAAQDHAQPLRRIQHSGLIVVQWVWFAARCVQEKRAARVLEIGYPRNWTGHPETGAELHGCIDPVQPGFVAVSQDNLEWRPT